MNSLFCSNCVSSPCHVIFNNQCPITSWHIIIFSYFHDLGGKTSHVHVHVQQNILWHWQHQISFWESKPEQQAAVLRTCKVSSYLAATLAHPLAPKFVYGVVLLWLPSGGFQYDIGGPQVTSSSPFFSSFHVPVLSLSAIFKQRFFPY